METPIIKTDTPTVTAAPEAPAPAKTLPETPKPNQEERVKRVLETFDPYQAKLTKISKDEDKKQEPKPKAPEPKKDDKGDTKGPDTKTESTAKTEESKEAKAPKEPEPKPDEKPEEKPEEEQKHRKTAKERVQESRREVIKYREELERVKRELEELRAIKDEDKSAKQLAKEAVLEEKMSSAIDHETVKLNEYVQSLPAGRDRERFEVYYNEIVPILAEKDQWTVDRLENIDNKYEVLNAIFGSISKGEITLDGWINSPKALKLDALYRVQDFLEKQKHKSETPAEPAKKVEDSVVPNISDPNDVTIKTKEQSRRQAVLNAFNPNQEYVTMK